MVGKVCMVTGASSGIGKVTALELARMGATVVMVCRNQAKAEPVLAEIRQVTGNSAVELMLADMSSQASIRALASAFKQKHDRLHVLVNNAGAIMFERKLTVDGMESTFATNHLGGFLLTNLLLDELKAAAPARVVGVSSGAHPFGHIDFDDLQGERKWSVWRAYSDSKLANVLFTAELARRLAGRGVTANCLHPGIVRSNIVGNSPLVRGLIKLFGWIAVTPEQGAETSIYLASSPEVEGISGEYFIRKKVARMSREAADPAVARRLWEVSEKLTGLKQ